MLKHFCIASITVICALSSVAQVPMPATPPPPPMTCEKPEFHQLDFWVGSWRVFRAVDNVEVATSHIESVMEGCGIKETYDSPHSPTGHYAGTSYSSYDRKDGKWHQMYIDVRGGVGLFIGAIDGKDMALTAPGRNGSLQHMVYRPLANGDVEQIGTVSTDGGKTWQPGYDYIYRRA